MPEGIVGTSKHYVDLSVTHLFYVHISKFREILFEHSLVSLPTGYIPVSNIFRVGFVRATQVGTAQHLLFTRTMFLHPFNSGVLASHSSEHMYVCRLFHLVLFVFIFFCFVVFFPFFPPIVVWFVLLNSGEATLFQEAGGIVL